MNNGYRERAGENEGIMGIVSGLKRMWAGLPEWARIVIAVISAIVIGIVIAGIAWAAFIGPGLSPDPASSSKAFEGPAHTYIAKIKVIGQISGSASSYSSSDSSYHHAWTLQTIDTLIGDANNKGIYLWLDTPGGAVYESDELYLKLMEYKEKTERPVYAYMGKLAASGGYYVASAADEIFANRNTWTGSIGVTIGTFFDVSDFLEEHGIHTETITAGSNKAMGSNYTPLTDEQKAIYQSLVDDAYDQFVAIVAEGRSMSDEEARKLADGRLYTASQALEAGLIDFILGEKDAENAVKEKFEDGAVITDCYYRPDKYFSLFGSSQSSGFSIWDFLLGRAGEGAGPAYEGDVAAVLRLAQDQEEAGAPPLRYLYTG